MPDRRTFLKGALALGVAGPLAADWAANEPAYAAGLTSQQLAGQRVIFSYPGLTVPASLLTQIRAGKAAGVIFFKENISSSSQIASVVRQLRNAQAQSPVSSPLLFMTDQEGGQVRRLPGQPTLSAKQIGQSSNPAAAASAAGTGAGKNLASVGMNVNLAPVLDVYYQAGNFIDYYQRSFSNHASIVSTCGRSFITAQQATGVAATAKHFPGLGAATRSQNTDTGSVALTMSLSTLRSKDEVPYVAAIAAGVKLIMVSWASYSALHKGHPAGLCSIAVKDELRGRLGFKGVTITDALEAGALSGWGDTGQRAVSAGGHGMDLILCSARSVGQGQAAVTALAHALDSGYLSSTNFTAAVHRVTALRNNLQ